MEGDASGVMWIVINVGAVILLGAALFYGMTMWRKRRSAEVNRLRDRETERLHKRRDPEEMPGQPRL